MRRVLRHGRRCQSAVPDPQLRQQGEPDRADGLIASLQQTHGQCRRVRGLAGPAPVLARRSRRCGHGAAMFVTEGGFLLQQGQMLPQRRTILVRPGLALPKRTAIDRTTKNNPSLRKNDAFATKSIPPSKKNIHLAMRSDLPATRNDPRSARNGLVETSSDRLADEERSCRLQARR